MPIRRFWVVAPMDLISDEQARNMGLIPNQNRVGVPQRAPRRAIALDNDLMEQQEAAQPQDMPHIVLELDRKASINQICGTEAGAHLQAKAMAEKTPTRPYGVFSCVGIYETKEPEVIRKKFNDSNEIVITEDDNA